MITTQDRRVWFLIGGIFGLFLLGVPLSSALFGVNYDYTLRTVALGGAVLGAVTGVLGSFAVLRQQSLMGDALSHAALPGVGIAFLLTGRELTWLLVGAAVAGWLAVMFIRALTTTTRIKQDSALAISLTAFFALGIAILTYIQRRPDASQAGLEQFIFGQAAAIVLRDVLVIGVVGLVTFGLIAFFWKEFKLITFDIEFARANGFPSRALDILISTMVVVAVVVGLQLAGVILMVGLLIAPAVAARQWTNSLSQMLVLSGIFGAFSGASGAIVSGIDAGLATGPLIIVAATLVVLVSIAVAPERGLVWQWWKQRQDRRRFAAQNVLRDLYDHALKHDDMGYATPEGLLVSLRGKIVLVGLGALQDAGDVIKVNGSHWALTDQGVVRAQQDARNRELWQLYRRFGDELDLPVVAENQQQDIAQVLPKEAIARLQTYQQTYQEGA